MFADVAADPVNLITLSPHWVSFVLTLLLPVVVALMYKVQVPDKVRAVTLIVLTALNVLITGAIVEGGAAVFSRETLVQWLMSTLIAVFMYVGAYKPIVNINAKAAPNSGLEFGVPKAA